VCVVVSLLQTTPDIERGLPLLMRRLRSAPKRSVSRQSRGPQRQERKTSHAPGRKAASWASSAESVLKQREPRAPAGAGLRRGQQEEMRNARDPRTYEQPLTFLGLKGTPKA
jgi:hypothetical protein